MTGDGLNHRDSIKEFRKWTEIRRAEEKVVQDVFAARLRMLVPPEFKKMFGEEGETILKGMFESGVGWGGRYRRNEGYSYGYDDLDEFAKRFNKLREAWKGLVAVSEPNWDGTEKWRFGITFTAL